MRYFSAAVVSRVLDPLKALLSSPSGRHSATGGRRRRRSTRVRRYAPAPAPAQVSQAPEPRHADTDEVRRAFARVRERAAAMVEQSRTHPEGDLLSGPAPRPGAAVHPLVFTH